MEAFIGQVILWAGDGYVPDGWLPCNGQILEAREHQALFSIIDNKFGGDGRNTFALPDLRGRVAVGTGQNPKGSNYMMGNTGGSEEVQLTVRQMPEHAHQAKLPSNASGRLPNFSGKMAVSANSADMQVPGDNAVPAAVPDAGGNLPGNTCIYGAPDGTSSIPISISPQGGEVTVDFSRATVQISDTGNNEAHSNVQPYIALQYIICIQGDYPPRPQ